MNLTFIDGFCGAGGATTGIVGSRASVAAAINHDEGAIHCHSLNHPDVAHYLQDIRKICTDKLAKDHKQVNALWWSSDCTHFSVAKGGQPRDADSRMLNNEIFRFISSFDLDYIFIENVREFLTWGPLKLIDGKPMPDPDRKGEYFRAWVFRIKKLGYTFDYKIINAADYGAPTIRSRFYGIFAKTGLPLRWPLPTHSQTLEPTLFSFASNQWEPAWKYLDLADTGESIRNKKLSPRTLERIAYGIEKHLGSRLNLPKDVYQFLIKYYGTNNTQTLDEPLHTITTKDRFALVTLQFLDKAYTGKYNSQSVFEPLHTITTNPHHRLISLLFDQGTLKDIHLRMLNVEELKRCQGFPESYQFPVSSTQAKKFIGNSVVPQVAKAIVEAQL